MDYENLKRKIEEDIVKLAKKIEQFCGIDNEEYTQLYKNDLWKIHQLFEDLIK